MAKKSEKIVNNTEKDFEIVVPKKTLVELVRILKDGEEPQIKIYISDSQIDFHLENTRILSGLIQGKFPNYRQVIPSHCEQSLRVNKDEIFRALKRASYMAQDMESPNLIKFKVHGSQIIITANTQDLGQAYEEVNLEEPGQTIDISFNAKYLLDALSSMPGSEILFKLSNSVNPGVIQPSQQENYLYVVMPVRLK
jgi:DNA polymerase-3 subunit beta